jgi:hypothetical protein
MGTWWLGEMTTLRPAHHKDLPALDRPSLFLLIVGRGMATLLAHPINVNKNVQKNNGFLA